jgi:hypothetical protein
MAVQAAYRGSHGKPDFIAALDADGLTLARVTDADLAAMAAITVRTPARRFPVLASGELVAVDRFGDVHKLNPDRPDADEIAERFSEPEAGYVATRAAPPSVAQAHAAFAARYRPTRVQAMRAGFKQRLEHVRNHITAARNGDAKGAAEGLSLLTDLVHDMLGQDTPFDCLRLAQTALATDRTDDARGALQSARTLLEASDDPGRGSVLAQVNHALMALAAGNRADCMRLIDNALQEDRGIGPVGRILAQPPNRLAEDA